MHATTRVLSWKWICFLISCTMLAACQPSMLAPTVPAPTPATAAQADGGRPLYGDIELPPSCEYWVAPPPSGNNSNPGTFDRPRATLEYASAHVPDGYCTVWFKDGIYSGNNELEERFATPTTFKAVNPYRAIFEHTSTTIELDGVRNMIFEGFEIRHSGPDADDYVVIADRRNDAWSEHVTFRNNIFHDAYFQDILKLHNGVRFFTIENNIFYNQSVSEQHMDVNSVTDILIQDNIFFNDFAGSGRPNTQDTKHFIVVKDSNEGSDGLEGSERVTIRRNIFLNWEGGEEAFIQIGNDGKSYHEAKNVLVENNLVIGNGTDYAYTVFGVKGARDVAFINNTVVGNLPADAYALDVSLAGSNPLNENVLFINNIWSDPTGTMGAEEGGDPDFSNGKAQSTENLVLDNNLYWNGGNTIPGGSSLSPLRDDDRALVGNPRINIVQSNIVLPRWNGTSFLSGNQTIREEFVRLVNAYGRIASNSPAIGRADPAYAPAQDILGQFRGPTADMGAYEFDAITLEPQLYLPFALRTIFFRP